MSFAEIKKTVNSNLNKTLDALITEKASDNEAILNNSTYGLSALKSAMTGGKIPIVKSVQRGVFSSEKDKDATITIRNVNPNKCIVLLDGCVNTHNNSSYVTTPAFLKSITETTITISPIHYNSNAGYSTGLKGSWQVIEFY